MLRAGSCTVAVLLSLVAMEVVPAGIPGHWATYVGVYPCAGKDKFFHEPAVRKALRDALGSDYANYQKHRALSGCGPVEVYRNYLFVDISQVHVGGYTSMLLFDPSRRSAYVFWLKSAVLEWDAKTYGRHPIPPEALGKFADAMNVTWGHVATFGVVNGEVTKVRIR